MTEQPGILEPRVEMHTIRFGGVAYPLCFSCLAVKRWAEHRGQTFTEAFAQGWDMAGLSEEDILCLLRVALEAGERRRQLFATDEKHVISDDLLRQLLDHYHPLELLNLLAKAWVEVPKREPDPTRGSGQPTGEECSE
jgi:hypothetical protein